MNEETAIAAQPMGALLPQKSLNQSVEIAGKVEQIRAAIMAAKHDRRDEIEVLERILTSCKRTSLAAVAVYKFPRGGQSVTGPSIRLAETLARSWGNLDCGWKELQRGNGESVVEAYCHDYETNYRKTVQWTVKHSRDTKAGSKQLTDERDIYEKIANEAARRVRACILAVIPADITEEALKQCQKTLASKDGGVPVEDRIKKLVMAFKDLGVSKEMLEGKLEHKIELTTVDEINDLLAVYNSIKDGASKRDDFFEFEKDSRRPDPNELLGVKK